MAGKHLGSAGFNWRVKRQNVSAPSRLHEPLFLGAPLLKALGQSLGSLAFQPLSINFSYLTDPSPRNPVLTLKQLASSSGALQRASGSCFNSRMSTVIGRLLSFSLMPERLNLFAVCLIMPLPSHVHTNARCSPKGKVMPPENTVS